MKVPKNKEKEKDKRKRKRKVRERFFEKFALLEKKKTVFYKRTICKLTIFI
jgi:hypothetical protein